jgi:hypothetical protein
MRALVSVAANKCPPASSPGDSHPPSQKSSDESEGRRWCAGADGACREVSPRAPRWHVSASCGRRTEREEPATVHE